MQVGKREQSAAVRHKPKRRRDAGAVPLEARHVYYAGTGLRCRDRRRSRRSLWQSTSSVSVPRPRRWFLYARPAAPPVTAAVQKKGRDDCERDGELDQYDYAEAGRERDREKHEDQRGAGVL